MSNAFLMELKEKISQQHEGDDKQLEVIFSNSSRIIVEAPAGYGKTTTMISRIAYLFATGGIPNPKRILGLTFSVNAALKVKREVAEKLPALLSTQNSPIAIGEKVTVTNYHGFCKIILKKYGYLVADALKKDINLLRAVGDSDISNRKELKTALSVTELQMLENVESCIKNASIPESGVIIAYNEIVIKKLLPLEYITHNAVILLVLEIFDRFPEVKKFYQNYYPLIVVDEFQDTNCIAWSLLEAIISDRTQLLFLGDPLQRIYGFIGALPDIMSSVADRFDMTRVALDKNYRFRNNQEMLNLDKNIRANAESCFIATIEDANMARLPAFWGSNQQDEAIQIVSKIQSLMCGNNEKIAILFRGRNKNAEIIETELENNKIDYFYGMFTDEDPAYIDFHNKCQEMFIKKFGKSKNISKKALDLFSKSVKSEYALSMDKTNGSLLRLLDALVEKASIDYANLMSEDKYSLLLDIFENRQLKQSMEYVDSQVILSTVHGAKGLEWEYVFLADVERWIFPGYYTCNSCTSKFSKSTNCKCFLPNPLPTDFREKALDELSVFYVGVTRARKQVYVSASANRLDFNGVEKSSNFSCLIAITGIKLVKAASIAT